MIDTDVLIWYLRGNAHAKAAIDKSIPFDISVISYLELIHGAKDKHELQLIQKYIKKWSVKIIQINEDISETAMSLVETYFLSHSLRLTDAIIAATTIERQEALITANDKHYAFIPNMQIQVFRP